MFVCCFLNHIFDKCVHFCYYDMCFILPHILKGCYRHTFSLCFSREKRSLLNPFSFLFTLYVFLQLDGHGVIEVLSKGTVRPEPRLLFEKMSVRDFRVDLYDHTMPGI